MQYINKTGKIQINQTVSDMRDRCKCVIECIFWNFVRIGRDLEEKNRFGNVVALVSNN